MTNKYLFVALALLLAFSATAQKPFSKPIPKASGLKAMPYLKSPAKLEISTPDLINPNEFVPVAMDRNTEELVGTTRWDAEGYGCVPSRVYYKQNGNPVVTWTFATDPTNAFPERGTGYSTRVNGNWTPSISRIETVRTGFPSASILSNGTEVVVTHATGFTPYRLLFLRRPAGATTWTESYLDMPAGYGCLWPHLVVGGPDGNTIHVIAITSPDGTGGAAWPKYDGVNGHILYWRSTDGGLTWDKKFQKIPGLDNTKFTTHAADEYAIDANGSTLAVAAFPAWNDLIVFKSFDNGDSWEATTVHDFPDALENYAGAAGDSYTIDDVGVPDPDAPDSLAVFNSDGSGNILIDDSGEVHLFFGRMYFSDTDPAAGSSFYPGINGLMHWKESFGTDTYQVISGALDYDGDGSLALTSVDEIAPYYTSLSSMPSSGADANGTIYVGYTALHELYRSSNDNLQFFRHVYVMKSVDYGENWGDPVDIITEPYVSDTSLIPYVECVYPMLPRHIGSNVGLAYQQDYDPGIHLLGPTADGNHPFVDNSLLWVEVDPNDIPAGTIGTHSPANAQAIQLDLSPNPASIQTSLSATLLEAGKVTVEIFDVMGNRVFANEATAAAGRQSVTLPVQQLSNGTYSVRLTAGKQSGVSKLVVAK